MRNRTIQVATFARVFLNIRAIRIAILRLRRLTDLLHFDRRKSSVNPQEYLRRLAKGECLVTIDLKELGKNAHGTVDYLRSRLDEPIMVNGNRVRLAHTNARTAAATQVLASAST